MTSQGVPGVEKFLRLRAPSNCLPKICLTANLPLPSPFSSEVINTWHFIGRRGTWWRQMGYLVLKLMWVGVHHRIPQHIISLNANFQFLNTFSSKVINPWHFLARRGTLWRHRWYLVLKMLLVWVHHRIPHLNISLKVNLQPPIPFSSKVINTWHFLELRGTLWRDRGYLVLKSFFVCVHHRIPYPKLVSKSICNFLVLFLQKLLTLGIFLGQPCDVISGTRSWKVS